MRPSHAIDTLSPGCWSVATPMAVSLVHDAGVCLTALYSRQFGWLAEAGQVWDRNMFSSRVSPGQLGQARISCSPLFHPRHDAYVNKGGSLSSFD
jgi:hypothetical protein